MMISDSWINALINFVESLPLNFFFFLKKINAYLNLFLMFDFVEKRKTHNIKLLGHHFSSFSSSSFYHCPCIHATSTWVRQKRPKRKAWVSNYENYAKPNRISKCKIIKKIIELQKR